MQGRDGLANDHSLRAQEVTVAMAPSRYETLRSSFEHSFSYYGQREGWYIVCSVNRDSDALERSNWAVISEHLIREGGDDVAIERMNHWAVGWVDYLLVRPFSDVMILAGLWTDRLAQYPVADDEHYSMLEYAEEWCVRCDSGTREQHPLARCHKFRGENDGVEIEYRWKHRHENRPGSCAVCGEMPSKNPSFFDLHRYGPTDHDFTPRKEDA